MKIKKKMGVLIACGVFAVAIGAVSAYASGAFSTLLVKIEDGVKFYSTDNGNTWSTQAPEGVTETADADGKVTMTRGTPSGEEGGKKFYTTERGTTQNGETQERPRKSIAADASGAVKAKGEAHLMVKEENGVKQFSTDGGKTWSREAPHGYGERDGISTYSFGNPSEEGGKYLTRVENGVKRFSADGGKTWSEQPSR